MTIATMLLATILPTAGHCASVDLTPRAPSLYMNLSRRHLLKPPPVRTPLFRTDLTLNDPPSIRLTPRWLESRGVKVELVGEDVVVTLPFIQKPTHWLAKRLKRLAK